MFFFNLPILDPLISLGIAVFILFNVFKNLRSVVKILLLEVPQHLKLAELEGKIRQLRGVKAVEDMHAWTLDGEGTQLPSIQAEGVVVLPASSPWYVDPDAAIAGRLTFPWPRATLAALLQAPGRLHPPYTHKGRPA